MGSSYYSLVSHRGGSVRSQVSPREICGGQSSTGRDFSPNTGTSVFSRMYHTTNVQCSSLPTYYSYQKDIGRKQGTF